MKSFYENVSIDIPEKDDECIDVNNNIVISATKIFIII